MEGEAQAHISKEWMQKSSNKSKPQRDQGKEGPTCLRAYIYSILSFKKLSNLAQPPIYLGLDLEQQ